MAIAVSDFSLVLTLSHYGLQVCHMPLPPLNFWFKMGNSSTTVYCSKNRFIQAGLILG
jgi:hypothetical protein